MVNRILYIEPFSGVAGDMFAAALLGLGRVTIDELRDALSELPLEEGWKVSFDRVERRSLAAGLFSVDVESGERRGHSHNHSHRSLKEINDIINGASGLSETVRGTALAVFAKLAEAEAAVHGKGIDAVHFHEVGATDAIIDIVSAAILLDAIAPAKIVSSPVALGTGTIKTAHGVLPVPSPATERVLAGIPVRRTDIPAELATPTGAAILATVVDEWGVPPEGAVEATGLGAGARVIDGVEPSLLRVSLIEPVASSSSLGKADEVAVLECWIDDMTGERFAEFAADALDLGALDVAMVPIVMKKGRPGIELKVLCSPRRAAEFADFILKHTSSLGVRIATSERRILERRIETVDTPLGKVAAKTALDGDGGELRTKIEQSEVERLAKETGKTRCEIRGIIDT